MQKALFKDVNEALRFQMDVLVRMASLLAWLFMALAHLAAAVLLLALAWWFQWQPSALVETARQIAAARPVAAFLAVGGSVLGLLTGYWRLARWAHNASTRGWIARYLTRL